MPGRRMNTKELMFYKTPTIIADILLLCLALHISLSCKHISDLNVPDFGDFRTYILLIVSYIFALNIIPIRLAERVMSYAHVVYRAIGHSSLAVIFFFFLASVFFEHITLRFYACLLALSMLFITLSHINVRIIIRRIRKSGHNRLKVLMVGGDMNLVHIYNSMKRGYGLHNYEVLGFLTDKYEDQIPKDAVCLGGLANVLDFVKTKVIDEVFCSINPAAEPEMVNSLIKYCNDNFIQFWYVPSLNGYPHHRMHFDQIERVNVISLRQEPLADERNQILKRTVDILASSAFLVLVYPWVWCLVAIGIKISSPGPILFRQKRTGYSGEEFNCLKFRSMKVNADADKVQATADDPRKTKFGDFIRRTSIDELPQFINVFKGDMSLVGPRPHMDFHTEMYSKLISDYMVRHLVKPGITGWAQVNGCRGETKTVEQMKERVEHDIWYIENWSPWLDVKILLMTVVQIFKGDKQAY